MNDVIYIICICFLLSICCFLVYKLYQFSLIILKVEEAVEESLELLAKKHSRISEILQRPVFFDSMEVRQVIADIKDCHVAIMLIGNILTNDVGIESEIKKESSEEES